jgi:hypothetical protein
MKFNDSAMEMIYEDAVRRINAQEALTPVQRVVVNEVLTKIQSRINEIELHNDELLKTQKIVQLTTEEKDLRELQHFLTEGVKQS